MASKNKIIDYLPVFCGALLLHILIIVALSFSSIGSKEDQKKEKSEPADEIIEAVAIDEDEILAEVNRIKQEEIDKKNNEQKRIEKLNKELEQAKKQRQKEEQQIKELKKKKELEKQKLKEEAAKEKKLKEERVKKEKAQREKTEKELKEKRIAEEKRIAKLKAEAEKIKKEKEAAEKAKKEAEEKAKREKEAAAKAKKEREAAERAKREAERKAREQQEAAENARKQREEEERQRQAAKQRAYERKLRKARNIYDARIKNALQNAWRRTKGASYSGLNCEVYFSVGRGGEVKTVKITRSSGDKLYDKSVTKAVYASSPIPIPADPELYKEFSEFQIEFTPPE